jgi:hypothetical protein
MPSPGEGDQLSFERDIKPLFRTKDRDSMLRVFDLFDYADVVGHADAIVGPLRSGQMPCDGAWPAEQLDKLQQWVRQSEEANPVDSLNLKVCCAGGLWERLVTADSMPRRFALLIAASE